ncbi:MAG TPA: methylated-DNA--[protein]-cysteine S-methyltransferase [Bacilli bacterium]|nr:methylated-DNA--[protein]-cysteine S-methyltransferase [Bacilli bacterium]
MAQGKNNKITQLYWEACEHSGRTYYVAMTERGVALTTLGNEDYEEFEASVRKRFGAQVELVRDADRLKSCTEQIRDYFSGNRQTFDLPLDLHGTEFQRQVWNALSAIPFGKHKTYGQVAREIGREKAVRAVGAACGANPVPIIVPCHRVIGTNGSLTGFAGGLDLKKAMLELEGISL